jgi:hypothetical protein
VAHFIIYHSNKIDTAAFSGGSWQANLPLSNLYSPSTTKRARSTNAQLTSTQFRMALTKAVILQGLQIIATNLSVAALYRITWYTDSTFSVIVDQTPWINIGESINWTNVGDWLDWLDPNFWLGSQATVDPDQQGIDIRHRFSPSQSMRYVKIEFDDTTNAAGYVEVGHVYLGEAYVPSINVAPDPTFQRVALTTMAEAVGGSRYFNRRGSRKRLLVSWQLLPREEVWGEVDEIIRIHDLDRPVYVDLDPDNMQSGRTTSFLARIATLPESKLLEAFWEDDTGATMGFEFTQVL